MNQKDRTVIQKTVQYCKDIDEKIGRVARPFYKG